MFFEVIFLSIIMSVGLIYNIFYMVNRPLKGEINAGILFSIICFSLVIINGFINERLLTIVFKDLSIGIRNKIFYIGCFLSIYALFWCLYLIEKAFVPKPFLRVISVVFLGILLMILISPMRFYITMGSKLLILLSMILFIVIIWIFINYIKGEHFECGYVVHSIVLINLYSAFINVFDAILRRLGVRNNGLNGQIATLINLFCFVFLLSFLYYRIYQKNKQMNITLFKAYNDLERTSKELRKKDLAFLQSQIKPHFLYNTLSVISSMITREPKESKRLILRFSDYLRNSFNFDIEEELIPLKNEIEMVNIYLEIEKARLSERIQYSFKCNHIPSINIPRLTLQPLVENALRHGILKKAVGGKVVLDINERDDYVIIKVIDNGLGFSERKLEEINKGEGKGVGINNINRRLMNHYGQKLMITSDEKETCVTVKIKKHQDSKGD